MSKLALFSVLLSVLFVPAAARAGDDPATRVKAAKKACAAGDFRKGVEILAELYVDTDDVTYIYNQGRCYEQNHQWQSAIDRFREYLRKRPNATAAERTDTEKHIADCETYRAEEMERSAAGTLVPPPPPPGDPAPTITPPERGGADDLPPPKTDRSRGAGLRLTGIVLGSAGAAAIIAGLAMNLKANSLASDFNRTHDPATRSSQNSFKTGALVGYGVGAGAVVTGIILYVIGHRAGKQAPTEVAILPLLTPTDVSLSLRRSF